MIHASRRAAVLLYTLIACMVLFWSANYIAAKIALAAIPPLLLVSVRISIAGLFILPFYLRQQFSVRSRDVWRWSEAPSLFLLGVLGVTLNQFFFVLGINYTSVAHAGIIIALTPLCVLLIAASLRMESITRGGAFGMLIALGGVAILQATRGTAGFGHPTSSAHPTVLGDSIVFLSALAFSLFTVFNKRISLIHTGITVNTFAYVGGALTLLPLTAYELSHAALSSSPRAWGAVFYMALCPSVLAYLIYSWALKQVPASQLAAFSYLQPLIATILAAFILNEPVAPAIVWSGLLILGGVMITERSRAVPAQRKQVAA